VKSPLPPPEQVWLITDPAFMGFRGRRCKDQTIESVPLRRLVRRIVGERFRRHSFLGALRWLPEATGE
jgi:hypothetical protein